MFNFFREQLQRRVSNQPTWKGHWLRQEEHPVVFAPVLNKKNILQRCQQKEEGGGIFYYID